MRARCSALKLDFKTASVIMLCNLFNNRESMDIIISNSGNTNYILLKFKECNIIVNVFLFRILMRMLL